MNNCHEVAPSIPARKGETSSLAILSLAATIGVQALSIAGCAAKSKGEAYSSLDSVSITSEQMKNINGLNDDQKEKLETLNPERDCHVLAIRKSPREVGQTTVRDEADLMCSKDFGFVQGIRECDKPVWDVVGTHPNRHLSLAGCAHDWTFTLKTRFGTFAKKIAR